MPSSDALIVVEDWISEHFFTTDARKESFQKLVLDRRKQWDGEDVPTTRTRFTERASKLATMLAALYSEDLDEAARAEAAEQAHEELLRVLGYSTGEFTSAAMGQCDGSRRRASSSRRWPLSQPGRWRRPTSSWLRTLELSPHRGGRRKMPRTARRCTRQVGW